MESRDQLQEERIARFWKRYVGALRLRQVPENAVPWYRKHVQAFIDFAPDIRLVNRRPETLEQWFAHTSREPRLTGWKHRQRVDALRLLYCLLVKSEWASGSTGRVGQNGNLHREDSKTRLTITTGGRAAKRPAHDAACIRLKRRV